MMKAKTIILIAAAINGAFAVAGCKENPSSATPAPPPRVPVADVLVRPITPFAEFTGSLAAVKHVELRPRVAGYVLAVNVPEGRLIEKGHPLFLIDPRPFQAALNEATARLQEAEAASTLAQADYVRAKTLFNKNVIARDRFDSATAMMKASNAQVNAAKAAREAAKLDLEFTRVTAPIAGRVGQTLVTEGNYVTGGVTPLTTLVSVDPLHVYFDVDERTYLQSLTAWRNKTAPPDIRVSVALLADKTYSRRGRVDFQSNTADRTTGTVRLRAVIDNPDGRLSPGLFARVKLETGAPQAKILIADQSIGTDQNRRYVLVVDENDKTEYRPVELGPVVEGLRVIEHGLRPGERIVVKGLVRPGMSITPQLAEIDGAPIEQLNAAGDAT
ncbi:efflux RND transporter periplasmic adaptor subunit [Serratia marcescens]|uniref:efflux RND transporter periplasmic adaptor subunit n=1 Tax=Serratia marcescens TaxID=615 RepID=UPI00217ADB49|nr:efflux RND transporter periplasmic adaptor subunit [Serratia marcescens]CAI0836969.1 Acriflavine resistance protein A precursor [Serratia marcescens]CAI1602048.1 Acriflavine resistance protein A precursor [Serratia marcescens]